MSCCLDPLARASMAGSYVSEALLRALVVLHVSRVKKMFTLCEFDHLWDAHSSGLTDWKTEMWHSGLSFLCQSGRQASLAILDRHHIIGLAKWQFLDIRSQAHSPQMAEKHRTSSASCHSQQKSMQKVHNVDGFECSPSMFAI